MTRDRIANSSNAIRESIFTDTSITASLGKMKDLRVVADHCMFHHNSDDASLFENGSDFSDCNNGAGLGKSLQDNECCGEKSPASILSGSSSPELKRRKSVTFADSQGGDLVQVREFDNNVEPIQNGLSDPVRDNSNACSSQYVLLFSQPCANYTDFMRQLFTRKVCLENAQVVSENVLIGTVKVQNLAYEKQVDIRLTVDSWKSFEDERAKFLHSESADIDVFSFRVQIPPDLTGVQFCVRYRCKDLEYWDNNDHINYCIRARDQSLNNNQG